MQPPKILRRLSDCTLYDSRLNSFDGYIVLHSFICYKGKSWHLISIWASVCYYNDNIWLWTLWVILKNEIFLFVSGGFRHFRMWFFYFSKPMTSVELKSISLDLKRNYVCYAYWLCIYHLYYIYMNKKTNVLMKIIL